MALRGGARNVIQWLREDHKQLDRAFKMLALREYREDHFEAKKKELIRAITAHNAFEESHLMPKFKAHFLVNFDQLKKDYLDQHIDLDKSVKEFEKVKITDNVYPVRINDLYAKFKAHTEDEEFLYKKIEENFTPEELEALCDEFEKSVHLMPTHPHSKVPGEIRATALGTNVLGLYDKLTDKFKKLIQ